MRDRPQRTAHHCSCQIRGKISPSSVLIHISMAQPPHHSSSRPSWGRRVPGAVFSLVIGGAFIITSAWLAWQHPLVILTCTPREAQPPRGDNPQHVIYDCSIEQKAWGLFTVGHETLEHVTAFSMHTRSMGDGSTGSALQVTTQDNRHDIFHAPPAEILRWVGSLNSLLDATSPRSFEWRHAQRLAFSFAWTLLLMGLLLIIRNCLIAPWKRHHQARRLH